MISQIKIGSHEEFIKWLETVNLTTPCSSFSSDFTSVLDLVNHDYHELVRKNKNPQLVLKKSFICQFQGMESHGKMLFHLCSYVDENEINHHLTFQSCEKELQIFELTRQNQDKDILMASVLHDQRAPLGSSQFYN